MNVSYEEEQAERLERRREEIDREDLQVQFQILQAAASMFPVAGDNAVKRAFKMWGEIKEIWTTKEKAA